MTAYFNPPFGDDATGELDSREKPFKTLKGAQDFINAWRAEDDNRARIPVPCVETHRPIPVPIPERGEEVPALSET